MSAGVFVSMQTAHKLRGKRANITKQGNYLSDGCDSILYIISHSKIAV